MNGEETIKLWERCQAARLEASHSKPNAPLHEKVALGRKQAESEDQAKADRAASTVWNSWALSLLTKRKELEKADKWKVCYYYDYWWEESVATGANEETEQWFEAATANFVGFAFPTENSAHFRQYIFPGPAFFWTARFPNEALFDEAVFHETAWFSAAEFSRVAEFKNCEFKDRVRFRRTQFSGNVRFTGCHFRKIAFFAQSTFDSFTSFKEAEFHNHAEFSAIHVIRAFELSRCTFAKPPSFTQADFKQAPDLDDVRFPLPGFWRTGNAELIAKYRAIRRMAMQGADYEREQMAFKGEIRSKRGTEHKWHHAAFWFGLVYDALSDFGRSMMRPLYVWLLSVIAFAVTYLVNADIEKSLWLQPCASGEPSKALKALTLSATNALPLIGSSRSEVAKTFYDCIGSTHLPIWSPIIQISQTLWSAVLIFLFLLAVRNQFKIK